jgi:hypothetical protein
MRYCACDQSILQCGRTSTCDLWMPYLSAFRSVFPLLPATSQLGTDPHALHNIPSLCVQTLTLAIGLCRLCFAAQGDEALNCNIGLSGGAFTTSIRAATSFHDAMLHSVSLHTRLGPEPTSPGAIRINRQRRPSHYGKALANTPETPQFEAMGQWLLSVAQDLLDPELCWIAEPSGVAAGGRGADGANPSGWRAGSGGRRARMTPRQRFEFLAQQVLWSQSH